MLYKNLHRISPSNIISITYKLHGTSGISSYILCKKPLKWYEKILKYLKVNIIDNQYDYIYSSRKVIKNEELNPNANHYYGFDIWGIADEYLRPFLSKGMTFYYEIVGYLPTGAMIQKDYDYGYDNPLINTTLPYSEGVHYGIYIYRITYTNIDGKVFEFSAKQVQDFCKKNGLKAVPRLYYGTAVGIAPEEYERFGDSDNFRTAFLENIKKMYNEKDCFMCNNKVPEEGCVVRIEGLDFEAYKQKSNAFYARETNLLDKGESNIEDEN